MNRIAREKDRERETDRQRKEKRERGGGEMGERNGLIEKTGR